MLAWALIWSMLRVSFVVVVCVATVFDVVELVAQTVLTLPASCVMATPLFVFVGFEDGECDGDVSIKLYSLVIILNPFAIKISLLNKKNCQ
jgi:hypothetical protein